MRFSSLLEIFAFLAVCEAILNALIKEAQNKDKTLIINLKTKNNAKNSWGDLMQKCGKTKDNDAGKLNNKCLKISNFE